MIHVTQHALDRYQERVAPCGMTEARRRILAHINALEIANDFGAPCVRNGDGIGFVVKDGAVTTILGRNMRLGPVA